MIVKYQNKKFTPICPICEEESDTHSICTFCQDDMKMRMEWLTDKIIEDRCNENRSTEMFTDIYFSNYKKKEAFDFFEDNFDDSKLTADEIDDIWWWIKK